VKRFMWSFGYNGCLAVGYVGRSGGLVLFWSSDTMCVWLESLCTNFIDVKIKEDSGLWWRATFVYGEPKADRRHFFWDWLHFLIAQMEWIMGVYRGF
jgi:hypothetical protein